MEDPLDRASFERVLGLAISQVHQWTINVLALIEVGLIEGF
jgi:hypothetical protein